MLQNNQKFMTKALPKAIMGKRRLKNVYLKSKYTINILLIHWEKQNLILSVSLT